MGPEFVFPHFGIDLAAETVDCISSDLQLTTDTPYFEDAKKAVFSAGDELAGQSVGTCRCHSTVRLCVLVYLCT